MVLAHGLNSSSLTVAGQTAAPITGNSINPLTQKRKAVFRGSSDELYKKSKKKCKRGMNCYHHIMLVLFDAAALAPVKIPAKFLACKKTLLLGTSRPSPFPPSSGSSLSIQPIASSVVLGFSSRYEPPRAV